MVVGTLPTQPGVAQSGRWSLFTCLHCKSPKVRNLLPSPVVSVQEGPSGNTWKSTGWGVRKWLCRTGLLTCVTCISPPATNLTGQVAGEGPVAPTACESYLCQVSGLWLSVKHVWPCPPSARQCHRGSAAGGRGGGDGDESSHVSISSEPSAKYFTHINSVIVAATLEVNIIIITPISWTQRDEASCPGSCSW